MDNSSVFYRSIEGSSSENFTFTSQRNFLKDNYTIEQIIQIKMKRLTYLFRKMTNLFENESGLSPERSCVEFAAFVKEKTNYINSLSNILRATEPFDFTRFQAEGYLKVKETLDAVKKDLKITEKVLKLRGENFSSRITSSFNRCKALEEIMEKSTTNKTEVAQKNEIMMKLSDEKLKASKQDLKYNFDNVFCGNNSVKDILESLVEAAEQSNSNKRWIQIKNKTDISNVILLKQAKIIKSHPLDETKITLTSFN